MPGRATSSRLISPHLSLAFGDMLFSILPSIASSTVGWKDDR
jgi:hypothetical protein